MNAIRWWHTIDLRNGLITPGKDSTFEKLKTLQLPLDMSNKTVLDIGAWDGFFSFEAEKRGALKVLAVDSYAWSGQGWSNQDGFNFAREILQSHVEDKEIEVEDISSKNVGIFDIVLFLGVLYHMKNPLRALEAVASVTKEMLIIETHVDMLHESRPIMIYYPDDELDHDKTSWWGPNPKAVEAMLQTVGFKNIRMIYPKNPRLYFSPAYRFIRALKHKITQNRSFTQTYRQSRVVYHAWK